MGSKKFIAFCILFFVREVLVFNVYSKRFTITFLSQKGRDVCWGSLCVASFGLRFKDQSLWMLLHGVDVYLEVMTMKLWKLLAIDVN